LARLEKLRPTPGPTPRPKPAVDYEPYYEFLAAVLEGRHPPLTPVGCRLLPYTAVVRKLYSRGDYET
jgi:hypothetical protein